MRQLWRQHFYQWDAQCRERHILEALLQVHLFLWQTSLRRWCHSFHCYAYPLWCKSRTLHDFSILSVAVPSFVGIQSRCVMSRLLHPRGALLRCVLIIHIPRRMLTFSIQHCRFSLVCSLTFRILLAWSAWLCILFLLSCAILRFVALQFKGYFIILQSFGAV